MLACKIDVWRVGGAKRLFHHLYTTWLKKRKQNQVAYCMNWNARTWQIYYYIMRSFLYRENNYRVLKWRFNIKVDFMTVFVTMINKLYVDAYSFQVPTIESGSNPKQKVRLQLRRKGAEDLNEDGYEVTKERFVRIQARGGSKTYVQTDKPIYQPGQTGKCLIIRLTRCHTSNLHVPHCICYGIDYTVSRTRLIYFGVSRVIMELITKFVILQIPT